MSGLGITGTGAHLPERVVTNAEVAAGLDIEPAWIERYTGVRERRRAAAHEAASDLAAEAARRALADAGRDIGEVGLIVVGTSTPDELGPSTACRVQALLGAGDIAVMDVGAACAGYLYGLRVARDHLAAEPGTGCALVIGVEVYSRFLDPGDRATAVLFGDGAGASVVEAVPEGRGIASIRLGADGRLAPHVLIPAGGSRRPASGETLAAGEHRIAMNGRAVREVMDHRFPELAATALARHGIGLGDLDLVVPHQPNPRALERFGEGLGLDPARLVVIGATAGNIGAASIPAALTAARDDGRLKDGSRVLMLAIGAGMTWASALLTWTTGGAR
ncbi:3-oxoacyl-[acyl-carrier-protein] synthase 3 [Actinorhabdospora filicis]|uniref:3-oxoacyl-[acyl-carrier-protein] synthase 3 n=1 Tax=Actinorhabdospora filicis TaxID=1785913 RepID=A0A9W6SKZ2_9ACTN|nr:ketoacyl-ACP synthase III [Actinorhabdospora filicis]GLZ77835.1 3-oxoacyl-[acyl-carrier-protein] synthase 3 [Actinorhabdospora filicis]